MLDFRIGLDHVVCAGGKFHSFHELSSRSLQHFIVLEHHPHVEIEPMMVPRHVATQTGLSSEFRDISAGTRSNTYRDSNPGFHFPLGAMDMSIFSPCPSRESLKGFITILPLPMTKRQLLRCVRSINLQHLLFHKAEYEIS